MKATTYLTLVIFLPSWLTGSSPVEHLKDESATIAANTDNKLEVKRDTDDANLSYGMTEERDNEFSLLPPQSNSDERPPEMGEYERVIDPHYYYPWRKWHDRFRPLRQKWDHDNADIAICLHVRPGSRKPGLLTNDESLGQSCTSLIRDGPDPHNWALYCDASFYNGTRVEPDLRDPDVQRDIGRRPYSDKDLVGYMATNDRWKEAEHCRAGCETCFDAMIEFGAEQAVCRRRVSDADCLMGIVRSPFVPVSCDVGKDRPKLDPNLMAAQCTRFFPADVPIWRELGYQTWPSAHEGRIKEDVRLYYEKGAQDYVDNPSYPKGAFSPWW